VGHQAWDSSVRGNHSRGIPHPSPRHHQDGGARSHHRMRSA